MIAVQIGPDMQFHAVAAPAYLAGRERPRTPNDLTSHNCINLRLPTYGGLYAWEFEKNSREVRVRVEGQLVFNSVIPILRAALDGLGVAYLSKDFVQPYLDRGELVQLMVDWSASSSGYHIYYPSRRQPTPAFRVILDALRHRA
jgi:DNA-binding transcriptional LysR family regulator